ncbi:MAG: ABC transporter substrate-binding protein [Bacilli bacterium]
MKKWIGLAVAFLLAITVSACGEKETKNVKLRLAEVTHSLFYAPLYVALEKQMFQEMGVDVELTTTWGGDKTMSTLLSGGADVALIGSETSIYVNNQNAKDPIINFAQLTQTDGTFLVSRKPIGNFEWSMLKGSTFLGQRIGGMPQMAGEWVLKQKGIDPKNDLTLVQNVDFQNIPNAFIAGTGDFVQLFEPVASTFEAEGKGYIVASFGKESGRIPYTAFMTKDSYMKDNEEAVTNFVKALYKAQQWVDTHSAKEIAAVVAPQFKDSSTELLIKVIDRYKKQNSYATNPLLDAEEWNNLQNIMLESGVIKKGATFEKMVNTRIAQTVIDAE